MGETKTQRFVSPKIQKIRWSTRLADLIQFQRWAPWAMELMGPHLLGWSWMSLKPIMPTATVNLGWAGFILQIGSNFGQKWAYCFWTKTSEIYRIIFWKAVELAEDQPMAEGRQQPMAPSSATRFALWRGQGQRCLESPGLELGPWPQKVRAWKDEFCHWKHGYFFWLVVWNMNFICPYLGGNNPNWRTPSFFIGVGTPPTRLLLTIINHILTIY